jgi:hypothetical protein
MVSCANACATDLLALGIVIFGEIASVDAYIGKLMKVNTGMLTAKKMSVRKFCQSLLILLAGPR